MIDIKTARQITKDAPDRLQWLSTWDSAQGMRFQACGSRYMCMIDLDPLAEVGHIALHDTAEGEGAPVARIEELMEEPRLYGASLVSRADLTRAVKLAMIFARDNADSVRIDFSACSLSVYGRSAERGDVTTTVNATVTTRANDEPTISVNGRLLLLALRELKSRSVCIDVCGGGHMVHVQARRGDGRLAIIAPMSK